MEVTILGTRGSIPVSGEEYARYGGGTSCVAVRAAGGLVILDCGSAFYKLPKVLRAGEKRIAVLLSHPHADHLFGFGMCPVMMDPDFSVTVYAAKHGGRTAEEQLETLFSPPLWPALPRQLPADITFRPVEMCFEVSGLQVETMQGCHPGGVTVYRLTEGKDSLVYATDCTITEELAPRLEEFARGCSLLIIDGQYSPGEWHGRETFGHNTWEMAADFGRRCGAGRTIITHHDPARTDAELEIVDLPCGCSFARAGERICLNGTDKSQLEGE